MSKVHSIQKTEHPSDYPQSWIEWFVTVIGHQKYDPKKYYGYKIHYIQKLQKNKNKSES